MTTKPCIKCGEVKPLGEFHKHATCKDGRRNMCKSCQNKYNRTYAKENPKKRARQNAEWYKKNRDKKLKYLEENRDERRAKAKVYKEKNRHKINRWKREKMSNDINYRIAERCRSRIHGALRGNSKSASTFELIGCSVEELKKHLENQFQEGMTWDNWGVCGWHIDHIRPCASFDLSDPKQQAECFHYTNLQPLWADENRSKWCKWEGA